MPRPARDAPGGVIFHRLNRGNDRRVIFDDAAWRRARLWRREHDSPQERGFLSGWPVPRPADWPAWVNPPQTDKELAALRESVRRGRPFGAADRQAATARALGLESTSRKPGRPKQPREK